MKEQTLEALALKFSDLRVEIDQTLESRMTESGLEHEILKKKYREEYDLLMKKYLEEFSERKRLYNEVIELKGNIRVFCRCRPLNQDEIAKGYSSVIDLSSFQENALHVICSDSSKKQFKFDHVFKPEDSQEDVFIQTLPLVISVLDGYNVCIFAYGQTGTGKTFTMEGTPENRGVNYRTLEELFKISKGRSSTMKYELSVSMLEVYNEKIRDLLVENSDQPPKKLEIKQSAEGTQEVPGLVEARVHGTSKVWELLKSGSRVRSVGSTKANELSSRSHCLLRVTVTGENLLNGHKTRSHLWLVDLAGSERVGKIEVEGERLKESQFINKSLSALGDVISALASKTSHIPYRNSKLTHILQSSLGGDCKTLMFVQTSPSVADLGETICSLNFATRVRGVRTGPARKQTDCKELFKYKQMAEKAKHDEKETKKLQDTVQFLQLKLAGREHIIKSLQEKVNFATRVRGVRTGPARKQKDCTELFKYKEMAEKAKHDETKKLQDTVQFLQLRLAGREHIIKSLQEKAEKAKHDVKETKKLQDIVQFLQLRLAGREHITKSLQEKVRDLEHQLAEERKARQKQETRALATVSAQPSSLVSSIREVQSSMAENKTPLAPARMRLPLRRIRNFLPQSPVPIHKPRNSLLPVSKDDKENLSRMSSTKAAPLLPLLPRRGSIAVRPPPQAKTQAIQPKRRASIGSFRSESSSNMLTPLNTKAENKTPLAPARMRLPLRRISNFLPQSPVPSHKPRNSLLPVSKDDKEYLSRMSSTKAAPLLPRRGSIAENLLKPKPRLFKRRKLQAFDQSHPPTCKLNSTPNSGCIAKETTNLESTPVQRLQTNRRSLLPS